MRKGGLEPPWVSPHAPQTCASAIPPLPQGPGTRRILASREGAVKKRPPSWDGGRMLRDAIEVSVEGSTEGRPGGRGRGVAYGEHLACSEARRSDLTAL